MYGELGRTDKTVGVKQTMKAVQKGTAEYVYVAKDADIRVIRDLEEMCKSRGIPVKYADSMEQLGKACGIDVGASAAGVLKCSAKEESK